MSGIHISVTVYGQTAIFAEKKIGAKGIKTLSTVVQPAAGLLTGMLWESEPLEQGC